MSLVLEASCRTFQGGPDVDHLTKIKLKSIEANQANVPFDGLEDMNINTSYGNDGRRVHPADRPAPVDRARRVAECGARRLMASRRDQKAIVRKRAKVLNKGLARATWKCFSGAAFWGRLYFAFFKR